MKSFPLLLALGAACSGSSSTAGTRDLTSNERIAETPPPTAIHASGFSKVVVNVDPGGGARVGSIPGGCRVQLEGTTLHVDGHGSVELNLQHLSDLQVTGHSSAVVRCLTGGTLDVEVSGQSAAELSGTLDSVDARITGGSDLTGRYLTVGHITHEAEGHSSIDLNSTTGAPPSCGGAGGSGGAGG